MVFSAGYHPVFLRFTYLEVVIKRITFKVAIADDAQKLGLVLFLKIVDARILNSSVVLYRIFQKY